MSKTRGRLPHEVHERVFGWVLALIAERGLVPHRGEMSERVAREMSAELLTQLVEQCLGFLQIGRPEPLGEPAVDRREEVGRRLPFVTLGPEPGEIACSTELEKPGMLLTRNTEGRIKPPFGPIWKALPQGVPGLAAE